jgi:hypothetical protein
MPPHWAQWAAVQPVGRVVLVCGGLVELVLVGGFVVVDVVRVVLVELGVLLLLLEPPPPPPPPPEAIQQSLVIQ